MDAVRESSQRRKQRAQQSALISDAVKGGHQRRTGFAAARTAVRADREQTMPALATCMQGEWMISMQAACKQHASSMQAACTQHALSMQSVMQSACNHRDRLLLHSFEERLVLSACHLIELVDAAAALSGRTRISMQYQLSGTLSKGSSGSSGSSG
jgi:hypothetical protein